MIQYAIAPRWRAGWIRLGNLMFRWTVEKPLFSERYGYKKPFMRIGKTRFFWCQ